MLSTDMVEFLSEFSLKNFYLNGDDQAPKSHVMHSEKSEIYSHITFLLLPRIEQETNLKLKPIYSYNRVYTGGSELKMHKDRPECEISCSITLKSFYRDKDYVWPLYMNDTPLDIKKGDGVIYKGTIIPHGRLIFKQPEDCWHHQLFVFYVNAQGPYKDSPTEFIENLYCTKY